MPTFLVRYGEISLKGNNRRTFVSHLVANIRHSLQLDDSQVAPQMGQILVSVPALQADQAHEVLRKTFGIAWFAQVSSVANDMERISDEVIRLLANRLNPTMSFAIRATRSSKAVSFTSNEVCQHVGAWVQKQTGARVNLNEADITVHIAIHNNYTSIFTEKIYAPGGLPIGTSGRILSLVSGGFDSIASSYLLAKRGASVDYLHFHTLPSVHGLLTSKMPNLWRKVSQYTLSGQAFTADYAPYQMALLGRDERYAKFELVTFRRLMVRVGEALARTQGYDALALGDSLGQVASQTMANIVAVDDAVTIPIFRPLIGMDKIEIMRLVRDIGLESEAIAPYKDCCSIMAKHPGIKANLQHIRDFEHHIGAARIADAILANIDVIRIDQETKSNPNPTYRTININTALGVAE